MALKGFSENNAFKLICKAYFEYKILIVHSNKKPQLQVRKVLIQ